jgi:phytoene dehydrogenase-like protein
MAKYDVVVIGGGPGGLCNAAILAKNHKKVLVLEKSGQVGGRSIEVCSPYEGYKLNLGWHQIMDTGSGLTRIFEYVGKELRHGPSSRGMPFWIDGKWRPLQNFIANDKTDFKKIIHEIVEEMTWDDIEQLDAYPIRPWIRKRTQSEGVLTMFEIMAVYEGGTVNWWDHSLSESLFMSKLNFTERRTSGYCFSPVDGWENIWKFLADAVVAHGGEIRLNAPVSDIIVENARVLGVEAQTRSAFMITDIPETERIEAPCVISTLPCWDALSVINEAMLPEWYVQQIKMMARDELRFAYIELYAGLPEPVSASAELAMPGWFIGPRTGLVGNCTDLTSFDPQASPPGEYLFTAVAYVSTQQAKDKRVLNRLFPEFEKEMEELFPNFKKRMWTNRHLAFNPTYTTLWKPGAVGRYKPDTEVPNIEGLYFSGDTFVGRSAGVDRAGRIAMSVAEKVLGKPIPEFKDSWHYPAASF